MEQHAVLKWLRTVIGARFLSPKCDDVGLVMRANQQASRQRNQVCARPLCPEVRNGGSFSRVTAFP